jgi:hypothetical protein
VRRVLVILVAACAQAERPAAVARGGLPDSVAQVGFGVRHSLLTGRVRRGELVADTALFAEGGNWVELRGVRVSFSTAAGDSVASLTARAGTYDVRGRRLALRGDVAVRTNDGRQLTAPRLTYELARGRLVGDTAFTYVGPDRRLSGRAFEAGPALRDVRVPRVPAAPAARPTP